MTRLEYLLVAALMIGLWQWSSAQSHDDEDDDDGQPIEWADQWYSDDSFWAPKKDAPIERGNKEFSEWAKRAELNPPQLTLPRRAK